MTLRLRPEQLAQHLRQRLAPLYLVHGDEELLLLEAADAIRAAARAAGYLERSVVIADAGYAWQDLAGLAATRSLFGDRRLIELRLASTRPGAAGAAALEAWAAHLPDDTITLITLPRPDRTAQGSRWFRALESAAAVVPVTAVDRQRLPQWLGERLAAQGQQAEPEALALMADRVEGNLLAAHQEVRKLALLHPPGRLSLEAIRAAVLPVARFDVFELADALAADPARYLRVLDNLHQEGVEPARVLWALAREIRQLAALARRVAGGVPADRALREAHVWESRQPLLRRALTRLGVTELHGTLQQAARIDRMIKGLEAGDAWEALARLGLAMARPKAFSV